MPPRKQPPAPGGQEIKFENPQRITLKVKSVRIKAGFEIKRLSPSSIVVLRQKNPMVRFECVCEGGPGECEISRIDFDLLRCVSSGDSPCTKGGCIFKATKPKKLELGEVIVMKAKPF
jgi:hypothetical protein